MTKEELIKHLEHLADYVKYSEDAPALREVIEMLTETHGNTRETHACDLIDRREAIDIERRATVDTNPEHFESHQKFVEFMDNAEISSFGRWQWSNGFNTALTAVGIDLKRLPSVQLAQQLDQKLAQPDGPDTNVGDTIYRQDAIDAICDNCDAVKASCPHYPCARYVAVEKLPSARQEPEHTMEEFMYGQDLGSPEDGSL